MDPVLEDMLRSVWGGITPYLMPLLLLALFCIIRVRVAEILAEMYYVFRRRYQALTGITAITGSNAAAPLPAARQERIGRFWDALCHWRDSYRDATGLNTESLGKIHIANGLLILNAEKALPFLTVELRKIIEEIMRDCIRERQIWQTAAEKREPFLKDAAIAFAKIDQEIQQEVLPRLCALLETTNQTPEK